MAVPGVPTNYYLQTANRVNFLSWDITPTATSYQVQRSLDGVNYTNYATPTLNNYLDTAVTVGVLYYYQVAGVNISGTGSYTAPQSIIPAPTSELALGQLRLLSQEKADRVNSNFVTLPEWNRFINLAMYELYDLLMETYEDYFLAPAPQFTTNNTNPFYPLPDGATTYIDSNSGQSYVAPAFYKLRGVDLGLTTANNAWVTVSRFNFQDRNRFVYPNSTSTIYGVFNLQYRVMGNLLEFIPTPSANQIVRIWYIPRLPELLQDTDLTTIGFSGWLEYVICRAAKYALQKEESDTSAIDAELIFIQQRIIDAASNRDVGQSDAISDTRRNGNWGSGVGGSGWPGPIGGF